MVADTFADRLDKALDHARTPKGRARRGAVAKKFGVSTESVRKWLTGDSIPDTKRIPEIAKKLGVNGNWLLTGDGLMVGYTANEDGATYQISKFQSLIDDLELLPDNVVQHVEQLVAALAEMNQTTDKGKIAAAILLKEKQDQSSPQQKTGNK